MPKYRHSLPTQSHLCFGKLLADRPDTTVWLMLASVWCQIKVVAVASCGEHFFDTTKLKRKIPPKMRERSKKFPSEVFWKMRRSNFDGSCKLYVNCSRCKESDGEKCVFVFCFFSGFELACACLLHPCTPEIPSISANGRPHPSRAGVI